jgi:hypothetical protein
MSTDAMIATISKLQEELKMALSRVEALEAKTSLNNAKAKKPRKPVVPKPHAKAPRRTKKDFPKHSIVWWGPEQDGKDPMTEYIPPAARLRVNPAMEEAYKAMIDHPLGMTPKRYNMIQAARLYYNDHGECPPDLGDYMH